MSRWKLGCLLSLLLLISGCGDNYAPVTSGLLSASSTGTTHTVSRGETLYAIAWRYDMDYRKLAAINHLNPPYKLLVGQRLHLKSAYPQYPAPTPVTRHPLVLRKTTPIPKTYGRGKTIPSTSIPAAKPMPIQRSTGTWQWPTRGQLIGGYAPANGFKGINIAGKMGQPIYAAASGRVAYSGNGLRGYGNLIIIKHNAEYLSAYAHNSKNLVHEGEMVKAGQVIALMGNSEAQRVMLHFEIRKAGQSVNPLNYLR